MKWEAVIGLGGNVPSPLGRPQDTLEAAIALIDEHVGTVVKRSRWYRSKPMGVTAQPDFVNGAVLIETQQAAKKILLKLKAIESTLGRQKGERWSARTADLDLLAYEDQVHPSKEGWHAILDDPDPAVFIEDPMVPHPRLHLRAFALQPFCDVWPGWVHPVLQEIPATILQRIPQSDLAELI